MTDSNPSDTYMRLAEQALSFDLGDPHGADAIAVVLDLAMVEGLALDLGGVQAYEGARPSPKVRVTAADMVQWRHGAVGVQSR